MQDRHVRWVEIIIAVSVVVISVASLFVAVYQSHVMQRQLEASVLPILSYSHGNYDDNRQETRIALTIGNRGLGPADIRLMRLIYEGQTYTGLHRYIQACCLDPDLQTPQARLEAWDDLVLTDQLFLTTAPVSRQLLAPGDEIVFLRLNYPEEPGPAQDLWMRLNTARWETETELCYCSVFGQCWITRFPDTVRTPVRACEAPD